MRAEDLYRLMEEPSELTEGTLLELRRIVEDYPYFQVARMLYLKNLAVLNDMSFTSELEKMAIFLPDRKMQSFSAYREFDSNLMPQQVEGTLCEEIIEEIVDQIYNATVANW